MESRLYMNFHDFHFHEDVTYKLPSTEACLPLSTSFFVSLAEIERTEQEKRICPEVQPGEDDLLGKLSIISHLLFHMLLVISKC